MKEYNYKNKKELVKALWTLEDEFEQYKKESVKWSIEDIQSRAEHRGVTVSDDLAQEILEDMIYNHDAELGINWITIDCYLDKYELR